VIRPGEEWGTPAAGEPDVDVSGTDADLAAAVARTPGALIRFHATRDSDLARAIGTPAPGGDRDVPMDALRIADDVLAVNMVVVGTPPDRLRRFSRRIVATVTVGGRALVSGPVTTIVVATGEFLRGHDVVPRGHPGDGRAEIQAYAVPPSERRALRARLALGTHVPHPAITQRAGTHVEIRLERATAVEVDGQPAAPADHLVITVVPGAYRLRV
jgi:hypothetical protein